MPRVKQKLPKRIPARSNGKHPGGQPSKLSPDIEQRIINEITVGASANDACQLAGIAPETLINWRKRAEAGEPEFFQFFRRLEAARVKRRDFYRKSILKKANTRNDWRGDAWLASVAEPEAFSPKVHVVVEQQLTAVIERLKTALVNEPDLLERVLMIIAGEGDGELEQVEAAVPPIQGAEIDRGNRSDAAEHHHPQPADRPAAGPAQGAQPGGDGGQRAQTDGLQRGAEPAVGAGAAHPGAGAVPGELPPKGA